MLVQPGIRHVVWRTCRIVAPAPGVNFRKHTCLIRRVSEPIVVKRGENGVASECKGGRNGRSSRKPADQRHRPARFLLAKIRGDPPGIEHGSPWWEASILTTTHRGALYEGNRILSYSCLPNSDARYLLHIAFRKIGLQNAETRTRIVSHTEASPTDAAIGDEKREQKRLEPPEKREHSGREPSCAPAEVEVSANNGAQRKGNSMIKKFQCRRSSTGDVHKKQFVRMRSSDYKLVTPVIGKRTERSNHNTRIPSMGRKASEFVSQHAPNIRAGSGVDTRLLSLVAEMNTPGGVCRPPWRSGNSLDSHSGGHGFNPWSGHPDFDFPWFSEITPDECWDGSLAKAMAGSLPFLLPCATCTVSNDLAADSEDIWAALNIEVLRAYKDEARLMSSAGMKGRGIREIPNQWHPGTIPTFKNPVETPPGIEPGSPRWEAKCLTTKPLRLIN
ncbi:hypothetical protein PR048_006761 [Dryococelus australis]|uniref:Uncharacterized protein n=1 Tax=Dryococelus australis TaxID=614101 RepID=A0ABQ9IBY1_9NEOP|nr:hypothetical protein PR048_006761 [Dryococelus australis]